MAGEGSESTTPTWESLEEFVRGRVQDLIQRVLEEEVTELLGREKSERREAVDAAVGYRNGYGKPRKLTMSSGTITLRRCCSPEQVTHAQAKHERKGDGYYLELGHLNALSR